MSWKPVRYRRTWVLPAYERRLVNRFTAGHSMAVARELRRLGGTEWFRRQLAPASIDDSHYRNTATWWPTINSTPQQIHAANQQKTIELWQAAQHYQSWVLVRRLTSKRHLLEVMTEFWENHFHVPLVGSAHMVFRVDYGKQIRARALGKFSDLLITCVLHPAMGVYLDNGDSTRKAPNENLGRELLELHTVGLESGYTEAHVRDSAYLLTGYRATVWKEVREWYDPASHWTGPVRVLDFTDANADPDGRESTLRYLRYLARHPSTARRICHKLATRFVSDNPSAALVNRLVKVYLDHDTAIVPVLLSLVASKEFRTAARTKVRTPEEDVVASYRALGVGVRRPTGEAPATKVMIWSTSAQGMAPLAWPRPDGRPDQASAWSSPSRMLASLRMHYGLAGAWWPDAAVSFVPPAARLPAKRIRFDRFVDHLSCTVLGVPATAALLQACCQATGTGRYSVITAQHPVVRWLMPRLLVTLVDSPTHMTR